MQEGAPARLQRLATEGLRCVCRGILERSPAAIQKLGGADALVKLLSVEFVGGYEMDKP